MSAVKRITKLFGKVRSPLGFSSSDSPKESELINAVIMRIEVEGEEHSLQAIPTDGEAVYHRLMRRLDWQLRNSGITAEELIRTYPNEVRCLLLFKSYEGGKKRRKKKAEPLVLKERLAAMGFKQIQPTVWVLPPTKTPPDLDSQETLKLWFRQKLAKGVPKSVDYVFPFIATVDLKKAVSERRGIRKMPAARTLFGVLAPDEVVPPSHVYATMKARGLSIRDIILSGNVPLLTSAYALKEEMAEVHAKDHEIGQRLRHATGASSINLEDLANLGPETVGIAFEGVVPHPKDFAQRMIVEAQYWMRLMGGTVPG